MKVGDKFEVIGEHYNFAKGEIVMLIHDYGTDLKRYSNGKDNCSVKTHKLKPLEEFKHGELVEVSSCGVDWVEMTFVAINPARKEANYITVNRSGFPASWIHCRKIQEQNEYTIEQLEELTGIKNLKIKK